MLKCSVLKHNITETGTGLLDACEELFYDKVVLFEKDPFKCICLKWIKIN